MNRPEACDQGESLNESHHAHGSFSPEKRASKIHDRVGNAPPAGASWPRMGIARWSEGRSSRDGRTCWLGRGVARETRRAHERECPSERWEHLLSALDANGIRTRSADDLCDLSPLGAAHEPQVEDRVVTLGQR